MTARGRRTRSSLTALAMTVSATACLLVGTTGTAQALAPDAAAWWSQANVGGGAPAPPVPPDVHAGDLYIEGSNALPSVAGLGSQPTSTQDVAGVSFSLTRGATPDQLTLAIDGTAPPQTSIMACRTTRSFTSESNGAYTDVPPYSCKSSVAATLKGDALVFTGLTKLVKAGTLSVVLLPGPLDRVVLKKPGSAALSATGGISAPPPITSSPTPPSHPSGAGPGSAGSGTGSGSVSSGSSGSGVALPGLPNSGGSGSGGSASAGQPPVVAPQPGSGSQTTATPQRTAARQSVAADSSSTWRRVVAGVLLGLEVVAFVLIQRTRAAKPAAVPVGTTGGVPTAGGVGGRLRAPDTGRFGGLAATSAVVRERGVGRFRQDRVRPPRPL